MSAEPTTYRDLLEVGVPESDIERMFGEGRTLPEIINIYREAGWFEE